MSTKRTQIDHLMAALSAAEQIAAATGVVPTNLTLQGPPLNGGPFDIVVVFHHRPQDFAEFTAALNLSATYTETFLGQPRPYLESTGEAFGVNVRVWDLGIDGEQPQYEAVVAPAALPAAWIAGAA